MKVKVYFNNGIMKGSWIFDFVDEKAFNDYKSNNSSNIRKCEVL